MTASLVPLLLIGAAGSLSAISDATKAADAIVVLGGDSEPRAHRAIELWQSGMAGRILAVGDGDCLHIRDMILEAGIPRQSVLVECLSENTWMNAANAASLLDETQTRSAILVTSWYHTARALRVFKLFCPGISWQTAVPEPPPPAHRMLHSPYRDAVFLEYLKTGVYLFRGWLFPPEEPSDGMMCFVPRGSR